VDSTAESEVSRMSKTSVRTFDTASQPESTRCDECGGEIVSDGPDLICDDCGLVVGEDTIDRGPDWRHGEDEGTTPRAGTLVDPTRHDNGFSTTIGVERGYRTPKQKRLIRAKIFGKHTESNKVHNQGRQLRDIKSSCENLNIPKPPSDDACVLFKEWHNHGSHQGHDLDVAAGVVTLVCARRHDVGVRIAEVCEQYSIERRQLFNGLRRLQADLDVEIPLETPSMFVNRFVNELDGEPRTATLAKRLAVEAEQTQVQGSRASSIAGGIVYEAFRAAQWEPDRTQPEVADVAGCSISTVRNQWHALQEAGIEAGDGGDLRQPDDTVDAGAKHAEDVEAIEPTADEPVVIGSTSKASTYHTAKCHTSNARATSDLNTPLSHRSTGTVSASVGCANGFAG